MADNQQISGAFSNKNSNQSGVQISEVKNSVFDMNSMLSAAQMYTNLNLVVNNLIGMDTRWFRAVPQQRAQDVIFQTYTLHDVEDTPLCVKVVLPDGNFPDSKYNYDLMGLEYEVPLEIHIDKVYWESIAGGGTAPQKKDIVYFAVPNKLYSVESSYLLRGFMEQETTWKLNLKKYQPEASRREGDILKETINNYTVSEAEIFGEKLESDIQKISNDKQFSPLNSTTQAQYKELDKKLNILPTKIELYGTLVAESFYDLNTSYLSRAISFNGKDEISKQTDRCISSWIMIDPGAVETYDIGSIRPVDSSDLFVPGANYILNIKSRNKGFQIDTPLEISRPGSLNFYATVISDTDQRDGNYAVYIEEDVVNHLSTIKTNWISASNYKVKIQSPVSILDGFNDGKGFKVNLYANQYIKIQYGTQQHISILTDKLLDKEWYGIVVNIGNTWGQYNTYVYKQHETDATEKIRNIFYDTFKFVPEDTIVDQYFINKSPSFMTNLRLYNSTMEEEKMRNELLSYFVKDGDQLVLSDNANALMKLPYMGRQR